MFAAIASLLAACGNYEEKRIRELWHETGFGTKAQGDATVENYVAGGDLVRFSIPQQVYQHEIARELYRLTIPQRISIDGKIDLPYVGQVSVLGMTEAQLGAFVKGMLRPVFNFPIDLEASIIVDSKNFYAFGETGRKGIIPLTALGADLTMFKALAGIGWTGLANLSRVYLIRPDAEHPLTVEIDMHHMIMTGYTRENIRIRENDIIYIPPTFLGLIARIIERALSPVRVAVQAMFGIASLRQSYDVASGRSNNLFFRF